MSGSEIFICRNGCRSLVSGDIGKGTDGGLRITEPMKKPLTDAELNELVAGLNKLSRNLWWTWDQEAQDLFQELSPRGWQNLFHNAVAVLREVSDYELRVHLQDADFAAARPRRAAQFRGLSERQKHLGPQERAGSCSKIPSPISPPSSASTNRCRFPPAASASWPATTRNPPATSASASSASACFTARAISSRRLTRTTGRRSFTIWSIRRTCRWNRC